MNRLIVKYGYPITAVILLILAWVVYRRIAGGSGIAVLAVSAVVVWVLGAPALIHFWPRMIVSGYKRALRAPGGFGGRAIPVNTLYADPGIPSASASNASLMATGTDRLLYLGGWLDLAAEPQVLDVPDTGGRYYNIQFTEPTGSTNFAYVGTRTTGTAAGAYMITGPGWTGVTPDGMTRITAPRAGVLILGRISLAGADDQPAAYALAQRFTLTPLSERRPAV